MTHPTWILPALLLVSGAAFGQASQPTKPAAPADRAPVTLKRLGTLEQDAGVPAIFSPDGKRLVHVKRVYEEVPAAQPGGRPQRKRSFVFVRCDADGKNATEVLTTRVSSDDMLVSFAEPSQFSADGKLLALVQADGQGRKAPTVPLVLNAAGDQTRVKTKLPWAMGFGYAGQRLVVLEGSGGFKLGKASYRLVVWDQGKEQLLEEQQGLAFSVRNAPDGSKTAIVVIDAAQRRAIKVRVIDLKTKQAVESPTFGSDDVTFDGPPIVYWDAKSQGVYYHAIPPGGRKNDCQLIRFDVATKTAKPVVPWPGVAVTAVLDAGHLAIFRRTGRRGAAILRLSDQAVFPIPLERAIVMGGRGKRLVVHGRNPATRKRETVVVDYALPTK